MKWTEYKIKNIKKGDKGYPKQLLDLKSPPKQIYYRGARRSLVKDSKIFEKSLGVVGSRKMTSYGKSVLEKFIPTLVQEGATIISGFMYGVDTTAHALTVEYGGKTVAVLGGGVNSCYPLENSKLYTKILEKGGVVMSEYKPDAKPKLWMYPQRNRIIAALSTLGVLVIEADIKSGSFITAHNAIELGRPLYAVPGEITKRLSNGTNQLIKDGKAKLVTDISDILNISKNDNNIKTNIEFSDKLEENIYKLLELEHLTIDELSVKLDKNAIEVSSKLTLMNMRGLVGELAGKFRILDH